MPEKDSSHLIDPSDPSKVPNRTYWAGGYRLTEFEDGSAVMEVGAHVIKTILVPHELIARGKRRKTKGL
jgi:hypothetical protein